MPDFSFRPFQNNKTNHLRRAAFLATVALSAALLSGCQTTPDTANTEPDNPAKALVNSAPISDENPSGEGSKTDATKSDAAKPGTGKAALETNAANLNTRMKDGSNNTAYVPPKIKGPIQMPVFADANDPAKLAEKVKQYTTEIGPILDKAQREKDVETIDNAGVSVSPVNKTNNTSRANVGTQGADTKTAPDDSKVEWMQPGTKGTGSNIAQPAKAIIEATPGSANAGSTVSTSLPNTGTSGKPMTITP